MAILDFAALCCADLIESRFGILGRKDKGIFDDATHLGPAIAWLKRSIERTSWRGSSRGYVFPRGWAPAYPETSGYIIRTLLRAAEKEDPDCLHYAVSTGEWLLSIQLESGGIVGSYLGGSNKPVVFNTGQVLLGFNALYAKTKESRFLEAGLKAAQFLLASMDDDGCFVRNLHNDIIHAYNVRTGWALIELGRLAGREDLVQAGNRNVRWTLAQQQPNGFFRNNTFAPGRPANLHGVAYVLSGILESYLLVGERSYLDAVVRTAETLLRKYGVSRKLPADVDPNWKALSSHVCLTGYVQTAIVFLQLFRLTGDPRHLNAALHLIDDVKRRQRLGRCSPDYRGAIPGSFPIYGRYAPLKFPNWAAKFFVDALLLKQEVMREYENRLPL